MNVLVVGCGKKGNTGMGIAKKFKEEGHNVIGADINDSKEAMKNTHDFLYIDVTDNHSIKTNFARLEEKMGRLDAVINSSGVNLLGQIQDYEEEKWDKTIDVNLKGNFLLLQNYVRFFDDKDYKKRFISITSDTAMIAKSATFAYGASKAGANHFIRCAARELNKYHGDWLVTAFAPGMIENTPMDNKTIMDLSEQRNISAKEARKMLLNNIPVDRGLTIEEVADWIYFITTKGDYASGNIIRVDGGQQQG